MRAASPAIESTIGDDREHMLRLGVASAAVLALVGFVFWHFFQNQFRFAIRQPSDWGHTLLIPFMAGYLAWLRRDEILRAGFRTTWIALLFVVVGIGWYVFCWMGPPAVRHHNLMGAGFGCALFGIVLLFAGWRAMRYLWFPLAFLLLFGITISDRFLHIVTYRLQDIAAQGDYFLLGLMQYDAELSGNTIQIWHNGALHPLNVAEACSGMRMLVAFLALAVFMAAIGLTHMWQRVLLVLLAVPIAVFVNVLRVVTLGLLGLIDSGLAAGSFHSFIGLVWLIPALMLFYGVIWILRRIVIEDDRRATPARYASPSPSWRLFDRASTVAVVISCITLLVCGVGFKAAVKAFNIHLQKEAVPLRRMFSRIPTQLDGWQTVGEDEIFDAATVETLGTNEYLSRIYVREDELVALRFHVAYYTDQIDAVPHVPERCMDAAGLSAIGGARHVQVSLAGMPRRQDELVNHRTGKPYVLTSALNRITRQRYEVRLPILPEEAALEMRVWEFDDDHGRRLFAGYFFIANGCATSRAEDVRTLAFDRTDEYAYYLKVEFAAEPLGDEGIDVFVARIEDLLPDLLPEIMRCLPDWSEVERGLYPSTALPPASGERAAGVEEF